MTVALIFLFATEFNSAHSQIYDVKSCQQNIAKLRLILNFGKLSLQNSIRFAPRSTMSNSAGRKLSIKRSFAMFYEQNLTWQIWEPTELNSVALIFLFATEFNSVRSQIYQVKLCQQKIAKSLLATEFTMLPNDCSANFAVY